MTQTLRRESGSVSLRFKCFHMTRNAAVQGHFLRRSIRSP